MSNQSDQSKEQTITEQYIYDFGIHEKDKLTSRIRKTADHYHMVKELSNAELVNLVRDDEIDIAVSHLQHTFQNNSFKIDDVFKETIKEKSEDAISLHEFTDLINKEWDREKKIKLLQALWDVANADNQIDKYEEYYIRKIKDLLYLSDNDFIKAKLKIIDKK